MNHDVTIHDGQPVIKVKVMSLYHHVPQIMETWHTTEPVAEQALQLAFENLQEEFWGEWERMAGIYFPGHSINVQAGGRSGGWLEVDGLGDAAEWSPELHVLWAHFETAVLEDIKYRKSWACIHDTIEGNMYWQEGSEAYNMVDTPHGTRCVAELAQATQALRLAFYRGDGVFSYTFG